MPVKTIMRVQRAQRGASLIEVLVSILIVSLGVVSLASLQAKSTQLGKASEFRAMAALLAADMADRMKANSVAVAAGSYDIQPSALLTAAPADAATACDKSKAPAFCTVQEMADYDLAQWGQTLYASIPSGTSYIQFDAAGNAVDLWVAWQDPGALASNLFGNVGDTVCPAAFQTLSPVPSCMYFRVGL